MRLTIGRTAGGGAKSVYHIQKPDTPNESYDGYILATCYEQDLPSELQKVRVGGRPICGTCIKAATTTVSTQ